MATDIGFLAEGHTGDELGLGIGFIKTWGNPRNHGALTFSIVGSLAIVLLNSTIFSLIPFAHYH
jgi:hypothetical protein